ncbi:glycoside hydrolase family protein [Paracoccus limosus]|uniref:Lysozyme n=1 Tax=Paracoccus limosus TaxID=913252 RepID=A0A844GXC8_9RHOB|nr:glycoside hydrolase family protein [Paracoccus limosus]MTH33072.1 glycoside hydrolase family protein [Paracoccus limosus]
MTIAKETLDHVKRWEGLRLEAYPDPGSKDGNPWTIGYGHTSDAFMKVYKGQKITQDQAEAALEYDLGEAEAIVMRLVKVPLSDGQRGALTSFVFNVGQGNFSKSTLLKRLNAGDYDAVPGQLAKWVKNDGKTMQGLVNRRAAEAGLWAKGSFVASRTVEAAPPSPLTKLATPEGLTAAGGLLAGLTGTLQGSGPVSYALAGLVLMAGAYVLIRLIRTGA